ncbi:MAG: lysophospholipid acyltransferase family protein [Solirubrobacterales bacterium]
MVDPKTEERLEGLRQRAASREPGLPQRVLKGLLKPVLSAWRTTVDGLHLLPGEGGVLVAPNHGSYLDHFFLAYRIDRPVQFMAAAELFSNPVAGRVLSALGAFPVRRGAHDEEAVATAEAILERGGLVVIYPQGGIRPALDSVPPRRGVGVLALTTGAPVIPAAIIEATSLHKAGFLRFPKITIRFGDPIHRPAELPVEEAEAEAASSEVWSSVVRLHEEGH